MPVRIPLDRHDTVVSVLRGATLVNADLEAYVEPASERERRAFTFAQWDRAAEGSGPDPGVSEEPEASEKKECA